MYDVRLNILNDKVEKFIVTEAMYSHSGKKKKLNFDIKNYPKFKDKIIYFPFIIIPLATEFANRIGFTGWYSLELYHSNAFS